MEPTELTTGHLGRPKDPKKADKILRAAAQLFLDDGFKGTSMDSISSAAGVSKQTLYSHFKGKDDLYSAVIRRKMDSYVFSQHVFRKTGHISADLNRIGKRFLNLIFRDEMVALYRSVVADGKDYTKTAELFYAQGPEKIIEQLSNLLRLYGVRDCRYFALSFLRLIEGEWHMLAIMNLAPKPSKEEIDARVRKSTKFFVTMIEREP